MTTDRIPDAELEVLAAIHRRHGATAREVRVDLEPWRPLAHSSVMTLLGRLEPRGLIVRSPSGAGREFIFHATSCPDAALRPILRPLVKRVFGGDPAGLVSSLYGASAPEPGELARLELLVEELRLRSAEPQEQADAMDRDEEDA